MVKVFGRWVRFAVAAFAMVGVGCAPALARAATPAVVGSVSDPVELSGAISVAVSGNYAYTTSFWNGDLAAVDLSNPLAPRLAGASNPSPTVENADFVTVAGGYAYVTSKNRNASTTSNDDGTGNSLSIFDIHTDPAHPTLVGSVSDAGAGTTHLFGAYGVAISGHYAYVVAQGCLVSQPCPDNTVGNALDVIDVSNPAAPQLVATLTNPSSGPFTGALDHADSVAISGHYAYVTASYDQSLSVIDIANPLDPRIVEQVRDSTSLPFPNDVAIQGSYAYVANETSPTGLLTVLDISNPLAPTVAGVAASASLAGAYRLKVRGELAYVAAFHAASIDIIDIANPASPALLDAVSDGAHLNRTSSLDFGLLGRYLVATSPFLSSESQTNYPPYPLSGTSAPRNTGTVSVIDVDPNPVSVSIASPTAGAAYRQGEAVTASYACAPGGFFFAIFACLGPVASGKPIDTSTPGRHTFSVTGIDQGGQSGRATVSYTVISPPPTGLPPALTRVHQRARRWRERGRPGRHEPPVGTEFTFTLNENAVVTLTFAETVPGGRQAGRRCVAETRRNRAARPCRLTLTFTTHSFRVPGGADRVHFGGLVKGRRLKPGVYAVVITATANRLAARARLTFTIVS